MDEISDRDLCDFSDRDLISELKARGYAVRSEDKDSDIFGLYRDWMTLSKESFEREMKKFFRKTLDIYVV